MKNHNNNKIKIDFSLKREIFFVVIGAIIGAIVFVIPKTIFEVVMGMPYYLSWIVFGHVIGVYSSDVVIIAGIGIHMVTAISIGVVIGIFLYKTGILNISKPSNGIIYGIFAGTVVFIVFFIPVYQFVLSPKTVSTLQELTTDDERELIESELSSEFLTVLIGSLVTHLIFGITVGLVSSLLSIKFGTRYRCPKCDISFGRIDSYQKHTELIHGTKPIDLKRILILGGGFAGIKILQQLQKEFQDNIDIDITIVSRDNFFLFTPMLPEVAASAIETRHITTPIRSFCKRARFYEANIDSINLEAKEVAIRYNIGKKHSNTLNDKIKVLKYDYLVLALGGETNFFGIETAYKNAFTIKTIGDALLLRNHVINMLEQADMEYENIELQKSLMTFVVVGGGFSGVETVGELNDFVRDSVKQFYHNIDIRYVKVILVNSGPRVLPEVSEELSEFTLNKLGKNGVHVILNNRVNEIGSNYVLLDKGEEEKIPSNTVVWAGGVKPSKVIIGLNCEHDKSGKIITNENLKVNGHKNIFALGDCAFVVDPATGKPYPPTAQHALREARVVSNNIINEIYATTKKKMKKKKEELIFNYKTKGIMALIGKRNGVGIVFGRKIQGFIGWIFWRLYYLGNLPTTERKLRVMLDWFIDLFFKRDITRLKTLTEKAEEK